MRRLKKIIITLLCVFLCMSIAFSIPSFASADESASEWMGSINGELTLAQFTIPGTHDSTTSKCILGRCQNTGIKKQLSFGVRFLDIRLGDDNGQMNCYHGFVNCFVSFSSVMEQASDFLEAHPTECIIMSIKNESGGDSEEFERDLVEKWIDSDEYSGLFYTEDAIPSLDEVRGMIVLLRRYESCSPELARGINADDGWPGNDVGTITGDGYTIAVQDHYSFKTIGPLYGNDKWQYFSDFDKTVQKIDIQNTQNCLCLNFASGTNSIACGMFFCAHTVNGKITELFASSPGNHGVVIMDYVTADLVKTVYSTNFQGSAD